MALAMEGADCVVVAGGDGSVACAAAALAGSPVSLGLIPCGTMNLLAKDLRIDPADRAQALDVLAHGRTRAIDLGAVNGHVFTCASMLGTRPAGTVAMACWPGQASARPRCGH
jgi:diacylglycerol kinase family enzyme